MLFVGRLVSRKGAKYPILALNELIKKDSRYYLIYIGDGPEKEWIENFSKENNLNDHLKLLGSIPNNQLPDYYRLADCLLFTSINEYGFLEAFCLVPLEAMACGLPVIAFDNNQAYTEKPIRHSETGLLAPAKDYQKLAENVDNLKNNLEIKNIMIQNGLA